MFGETHLRKVRLEGDVVEDLEADIRFTFGNEDDARKFSWALRIARDVEVMGDKRPLCGPGAADRRVEEEELR